MPPAAAAAASLAQTHVTMSLSSSQRSCLTPKQTIEAGSCGSFLNQKELPLPRGVCSHPPTHQWGEDRRQIQAVTLTPRPAEHRKTHREGSALPWETPGRLQHRSVPAWASQGSLLLKIKQSLQVLGNPTASRLFFAQGYQLLPQTASKRQLAVWKLHGMLQPQTRPRSNSGTCVLTLTSGLACINKEANTDMHVANGSPGKEDWTCVRAHNWAYTAAVEKIPIFLRHHCVSGATAGAALLGGS